MSLLVFSLLFLPFSADDLPRGGGEAFAVFLIVAPDSLADAWEELAEWRRAEGWTVRVAPLSEIEAAHPEGVDRADKIRRYIRDAYTYWGTRYVLLGADAPEIPMRTVWVPLGYEWADYIPTDLYYACLEGSWNADGDSLFGEVEDEVDLSPEVAVGRFPAHAAEDVRGYVTKLRAYDRPPVDQPLDRVVLLGSNVFQPGDGADLCELVSAHFPENFERVRLYETEMFVSLDTLVGALNAGPGFFFSENHATFTGIRANESPAVWFTNGEVPLLNSRGRYGIYHIVGCYPGGIDRDALVERWMRHPQSGAVAFWATTRLNFPYIALYLNYALYDTLFSRPWITVGEADLGIRQAFAPPANYLNTYRYLQFAYMLFGDPTIVVRKTRQRELGVSAPPYLQGPGSHWVKVRVWEAGTGAPVEGVRVVLYRPGTVRSVGLTDSAGYARLPVVVWEPGPLLLTLFHPEYRTRQDTLWVLDRRNPPLEVLGLRVEEVQGDGDGLPDAGEALRLSLEVRWDEEIPLPPHEVRFASLSPELHLLRDRRDSLSAYGLLSKDIGNQERIAVTYALRWPGGQLQDTLTFTAYAPVVRISTFRFSPQTDRVLFRLGLMNEGDDAAREVRVALHTFTGWDTLLQLPRLESRSGFPAYDSPLVASIPLGGLPPESLRVRVRIWTHLGEVAAETVHYAPPLSPPQTLVDHPGPGWVQLVWDSQESTRFLVLRSVNGGPFVPLTPLPTEGAYFEDRSVQYADLTRYRVVPVDTLGREGVPSDPLEAAPNPPPFPGFPVSLESSAFSSPLVADLDPASPGLEIVAARFDGWVYLIRADGTIPEGWPLQLEGDIWSSPAAGDFDGDGALEFAIGRRGGTGPLHVLNADGSEVPGWPRPVQGGLFGPPVAVDFDGDGADELLVPTQGGKLLLYRGDGSPLLEDTVYATGTYRLSSPAVGDVDGNGVLDVVYSSGDQLWVRAWTGDTLPGFPVSLPQILSFPILADFLPDVPGLEIAFGVGPREQTSLYLVTASGEVAPGWPAAVAGDHAYFLYLSAGDLNGDGIPELVVHYLQGITAFRSDGTPLPGFDHPAQGGPSSPVLADVNGDGLPEVFFGDVSGLLRGYGLSGRFKGFPVEVGPYAYPTPTVADLNGDGVLEIVAQSYGGQLVVLTFEMPGGPVVWGTLKHDIRRTGNLAFSEAMGGASGILGKAAAAPPGVLDLKPFWKDGVLQVSFILPKPGNYRLSLYTPAGRRAAHLLSGRFSPGQYIYRWPALQLPIGLYLLRLEGPEGAVTRKVFWVRR